MEDVQKSIIRQSSIKASLDFWKIKAEQGNEDITIDTIIDTASEIAYYCATGKKYNNNNKLAENPNCIQKVGDRKFLNLTVGKLKNKLKAGQDLYVAWNDFTPAKTVEDKASDMPF